MLAFLFSSDEKHLGVSAIPAPYTNAMPYLLTYFVGFRVTVDLAR